MVYPRETGSARCRSVRSTRSRPVSIPLPLDTGRLASDAPADQPSTRRERSMRPIPEAADVTEADRLQCRNLIEAASFYAVDTEMRRVPGSACCQTAIASCWRCGSRGSSASPSARSGSLSVTPDGHARRRGRPDDPGRCPRARRDIRGARRCFRRSGRNLGESDVRATIQTRFCGRATRPRRMDAHRRPAWAGANAPIRRAATPSSDFAEKRIAEKRRAARRKQAPVPDGAEPGLIGTPTATCMEQ